MKNTIKVWRVYEILHIRKKWKTLQNKITRTINYIQLRSILLLSRSDIIYFWRKYQKTYRLLQKIPNIVSQKYGWKSPTIRRKIAGYLYRHFSLRHQLKVCDIIFFHAYPTALTRAMVVTFDTCGFSSHLRRYVHRKYLQNAT